MIELNKCAQRANISLEIEKIKWESLFVFLLGPNYVTFLLWQFYGMIKQ